MNDRRLHRPGFASLCAALTLLAGAGAALLGDCGPFTDVSLFCSPILELYYLGVASGTSPTTFAPNQVATRGETAAFVARSFNQSIKRSSRRAALGQWWMTAASGLQSFPISESPGHPQCDGSDIWIPHVTSVGQVTRVRASDARILESWDGAISGVNTLIAMGRVFVIGQTSPGSLYMIDPGQPAGTVTTVADNLGSSPRGVAFDGARIITANSGGSVSIITPGAAPPWTVTTITAGFQSPAGAIFDGTSTWVTDAYAQTLLKLDSTATVVQTVPVGLLPGIPTFDGENIWVPNVGSASVTVVRASTGAVIATLTGNGLGTPFSAAFDGQRILVAGDNLSLWRAADLAPLGSVPVVGNSSQAVGVCSDGLNFWVATFWSERLARF
jgi:hypothetical protein